MSFSFKKPTRKFRQRTRESESEEENLTRQQKEDDEDKIGHKLASTTITNEKANNSKKPIDISKAKLSFHDDEDDGDVFKVKKSNQSRRIAKQVEKDRRKNNGEVKKENKEYLVKKKPEIKEENPEQSVRKRMEQERPKKDELNVVWVKSESVRIPTPPIIDIPAEDPFSDDSADEDESHPFRSALARGVIPDAKTIYELKKQRQMRRDADEFIPLAKDSDKLDDDEFNMNDTKGDDDDEEDEDDRIEFRGLDKDDEDEKNREAIFSAQDEQNIADADNELSRWEREQIRKALGSQSVQETVDLAPKARKSKKRNTQIPDFIVNRGTHPKTSLDDLSRRLKQSLKDSQEQLAQYERQLVTLGIESKQANDEVKVFSSDVHKIGKEFEFYQIVSNYIESRLPS